MNKKIHQIIIFLFLFVCSHQSIASDRVTLTKELIETLNVDAEKSIGLINGEKYVVSWHDGHILIVAKINNDNNYEPVALAKLGYLPYPEALIKNNSIIVHGFQGHNGTYDTKYVFRLKNRAFYLSSLREEFNYSKSPNEPDIQIMERTTINFDKSTIHHWEQRFNLNKKSERIEWNNSNERPSKNLPMLGGVSKTIKFKRKEHALNNFNFDTDISSLTHHSSETPNGAP